MRLRAVFLSSCMIPATLAAQSAYAQDQAGADTTPPPAEATPAVEAVVPDAETSGEDIVVTARRREESIQDVPISVSAISGEDLAKSGVVDIQGLQYRTPSLSITSAQSQRNTVAFSLRGQRTQETQLFTDAPVGTYFAEVVQPRPYGFGQSLFDLESVQVLKGVQGTLFGRNMTGGAVLVEPRHPRLGEVSGQITGQYGNFDLRDVFAAVNLPLGDIAAFRFAGKFRRRDGWAHEVTSGLDYDNQHYEAFRASALIEPTDRLSTLFILDYFNLNENGTAAFLTAYDPNKPGRTGCGPATVGLTATQTQPGTNFLGTPCSTLGQTEVLGGLLGLPNANITAQATEALALQRQGSGYFLNTGVGEGATLNSANLDFFSNGPFEKIRNYGVTNKTTWELSDAITLKNIIGYRKLRRRQVQDYDGIPAFVITPFQESRTRNFSEEFQIQGNAMDKRLTYILGAYYFQETGSDGSLANSFPQLALIGLARAIPGAGINPATTSAGQIVTANPGRGYSRTAATFLAGTFKFTDQLSVSGGIRYNYDKRKITVSPSNPLRTAPLAPACIFDTDLATTGTQTLPFNQCRFTDSVTFEEPTYDATIQYEPNNQITAYASFRHGFRAGGYSTRATNFFTLRPFLPEFVDEYEVGLKTNHRLGDGVRLTTSTALFRQDGSDVQKQRATSDPVTNQIFTVVTNTSKQRNTGGEIEATLKTPNVSITAFYSYTKVKILGTPGTPTGPLILAGLPEIAQRGVPKHQVGGTVTFSPPIGDFAKLNLTANATYRSETFLDDFELQGRQKPYGLLNLRAGLDNIRGSGFSAAVFGTNVTDTKYRSGILGLLAEGVGFSSSVFGEPRMYGIELGYEF